MGETALASRHGLSLFATGSNFGKHKQFPSTVRRNKNSLAFRPSHRWCDSLISVTGSVKMIRFSYSNEDIKDEEGREGCRPEMPLSRCCAPSLNHTSPLSRNAPQQLVTWWPHRIPHLSPLIPPPQSVYKTMHVSQQRMHSIPTGCWPSEAFWQVYIARQIS